LDVARHFGLKGSAIDPRTNHAISAADLDDVAAAQGVDIRPGDILLIRTGWLDHYVNHATSAERQRMPIEKATPGLLQSHETLAWLWDHQISVCAADNPAVEAQPAHPSSPFVQASAANVLPRHKGLMHAYLIAMLGLVLGELWNMEALSQDCASDGVWEFFVTVKPLNLVGGVGSPPNALALK
jgi:kynurenine formamidase